MLKMMFLVVITFILNAIPYIVSQVHFRYLSLEMGNSGYNSFNNKSPTFHLFLEAYIWKRNILVHEMLF